MVTSSASIFRLSRAAFMLPLLRPQARVALVCVDCVFATL